MPPISLDSSLATFPGSRGEEARDVSEYERAGFGEEPRRIYADFIVALRDGEAGADDGFHRVFVVETKGVHLKESEDTEYKRSVFYICGTHARKTDWAEFVPAMRSKVVRFDVVDEDKWQARLNGMLFGARD